MCGSFVPLHQTFYRLAEMIGNQSDLKVLSIKDYIKNPKESGYKSYHMLVSVPISCLTVLLIQKLRYRFGPLPWISGQVWNISFAIKKISRQIRHSNCRRSFWRVPPRVLSWITGMQEIRNSTGSAELIRGINPEKVPYFRNFLNNFS